MAAAVAIGVVSTMLAILLRHVARLHAPWTVERSRELHLELVPSGLTDTAQVFAAIDRYLSREMNAVRAPGVAIAIVHDNRIVHVRGFGQADPSGRPVTGDVPFILGSMTKSFTALAIVQLAEAGRLGLDDPVQRYLPWFHVRDRNASARMNIRQLLNHTSGLPKSAGLQLVRGAEAATQRDQMRLLARVRLNHAPGEAFEYSNANYWLLGLIVERAAGEPYEAYVGREIFAPLGMARSFTSEEAARAHGLAQGYRVWFGFPRAQEMPYYARELSVGYLISSANDVGRYLIAHLNGGREGGARIISPEGLAQLHTPPRGSPYAMGWLSDEVAGVPVLWHTGAVANYHGDMLIVPSAGWGVVVLSNVNNFLLETQFSSAIKGMTALLLGYQPAAPSWLRYRAAYWLMTGLACIWLVWRGYQIFSLRRWIKRSRVAPLDRSNLVRHPVTALIDPGLSLGLFFGIPVFLEAPLSTMMWFAPDMTSWLVVNTIVSLLVGGLRLALLTPIEKSNSMMPRTPRPG
jgi:CubicO group peptidase (beta-lactamase class C family)